MPPRPSPEVEVPKEVAKPAIPPAWHHLTTLDLIASLIRPGADDNLVKRAAHKLAEDLHSLDNHRKILAEVRAGNMPLKVVLAAYKASKGTGVEDRRKIFTAFIGREIEDREKSKKPRPGPSGKVSRPGRRS